MISFAANPTATPDGEKLFKLLLESRDCREALAFVIEANHAMASGNATRSAGTKEDLVARRVRFFLSRCSARSFRVEDASGEADAIAAGMPDDGRLYFRGESGGRSAIVWRAEIRVPQAEAAPDWLDVGISCKGGGVEMLDGTFRLCGATAEIRNGEGRLSRQTLAESLAQGGVSFTPSGKREIPGAPVFGDLI